MSDDIIAGGIRYYGKDGCQRWMNGTQLVAFVHAAIAADRRAFRAEFDELVEQIGMKTGALQAEVRALRAELAEIRKSLPPLAAPAQPLRSVK